MNAKHSAEVTAPEGMSLLLAREGAAVALADLNAASAEATAELLRDEGADPIVIEADAASEEAMSGAIEATREAVVDGGLTIGRRAIP